VLEIDVISDKLRKLRAHYFARDSRYDDLLAIRQGKIDQVFPGMFSEDYPKPMVANFIDVAARDVAEVIAPLPAFNCMTTKTTSDRARERSDKRTMIAAGYRDTANLQTMMYTGADRYLTFGWLPFLIEADYENNRPMIRIDSPIGAYPEFDRFSRLISYSKRYVKTIRELINDFPEHENVIRGQYENRNSERILEMYRYQDKDQMVLFLPERNNFVLSRVMNELGEIPVAIALRPGVDSDEHQRGQFDDIMWVQVARSRFASLTLEAAQKAVQAPFALPSDVNVLEIGPDATIRSANPQLIRRVDLNLPPNIFQENEILDQEMRTGSRYPEGRLGQQSGSIVTGRGVEALMGGFDTQVKTAQGVFSETFREVIRLCFKMDEKLFGDVTKEVRGINAGAPYAITYTPNKDIAGDYSCDVTYGMMAGLDPNRALVFGLQARGDKLISRDFLRRQMPWEMNVTQEEERVEVEELRDTLLQAVASYANALPQMAMQGADPTKVIQAITQVIIGRQNGDPIEEVVAKAFAPETPPPQAEPQPNQQPGEQPGQPPQPGQAPNGAAPGMPPAPQGQPGASSLQNLLAGLSSSGAPQLSANVARRSPA
jgi:hypothetical protein